VNLGTQVRRVDPQQDPASAQKVPERGDQEADVQGATADSKFKEQVAAEEKRNGQEKKAERKEEQRTVPVPKTEEGARAVLVPAPQREPVGVPAQRKARSSSDSESSNHRKASVMNKVKGEMKVLLGKASRNREMVEGGEKLKHGSN